MGEEVSGGTGGLNVIIVGAGIGGAAAAVALRRAGHRVTVLEQAAELVPAGAGIQLAPNATRILAQFGVTDVLAKSAVTPQRVVRRSWDDARILGERPFGASVEAKYGAPYWHMHRADLHFALIDAAKNPDTAGRPADFRFATEVTALEETAAGPVVITASGDRHQGDLVIGADGVHSRLRARIFGYEDRRAIPRGVAYRSLIPASALGASGTSTSSGTGGRFADILGPEPALTEWLSPGVHVIHYFISGGEYLNIAVLRYNAETDPGVESWLREGDREEFLGLIDGWDPRLTQLAGLAGTVFCTGVYERPPLPEWIRGQIALLGDAAHPMMPTQAQGAAQSIEDAWYLGRVLRGVTPDTLTRALAAYQDERLPRTTAVQQLSARDRGAHLGRPGGETAPASASVPAPEDRPTDFGPYEWLWPYGEDTGDVVA